MRTYIDLLTRYLPSPEDWYPSYPDGTVRALGFWRPRERWGRVCVWGMDDTGFERDFVDREALSREVAWVAGLAYVTRQMLTDRGWRRA